MASKKNGGTVHVVPSSRGGWDVKRGGGERASSHHDTKADAVQSGRDLSRNSGSEFYVHNKDGKIAVKDSHGGDKYPPKG